MEASTKSHHRMRAAFGFIVPAAVLNNLAWGVAVPVLPGLMKHLVHEDLSLTARYVGWSVAAFAIMQFIAAPLIGALSDRYGRRPVLLLSMFGMALDFCIMAVAPSVWLLFVGRMIGGVTASSFATANAYVADISEPSERAKRFGALSAAAGVGLLLGPLAGGLLGQFGLRLPFWVGAALSLLNAVYGIFVLPESLTERTREPLRLSSLNPLSVFAIYRGRQMLTRLAAVSFLFILGRQVLYSAMLPYLDARYHFTPLMLGVAVMLLGGGMVAAQSTMAGPATKRLGEFATLALSLLAGCIAMLGFGLAPTGFAFVCVTVIFAFASLQSPVLQALMTANVDPTAQGRLQGTTAALNAVTSAIGPVMFGELLAAALGPWMHKAPIGLPFFVAAAIIATSLLLALSLRPSLAAAQPRMSAREPTG